MSLIIAEPKGKTTNCDALSLCVCMYICIYVYIRCLFRNVPDSKRRLLSNVLTYFGKTNETVANWNN